MKFLLKQINKRYGEALWLSLILVLLASCADIFQPKIPFNEKDPASLDDLFKNNEGVGKLKTPDQFYIPPNYSSTEIRLTWTGVNGAAYYMVERAVASPIHESNPPAWENPDEGDYVPLDRFVYSTSFTDVILRNPSLDSPEYQNKYFYRVSAFNTALRYEESEPTSPQSAMLFSAPRNLRATGGVSVEFVELRWDRCDGAEAYEIWRSDLANGASASLLSTVLGNQNWYRNNVSPAEQGKDFYYMIRARNRFQNYTLYTRPAYGYARIFGAPDSPKNVKLDDNSGRGHSKNTINIKWDAVTETGAYYAVFRYSSIDSSLTRLIERTSETKWTDNIGLRPGIFYYYRVQAIVDDISGRPLRSEFSSQDPEGFILSSPDTVVAEKDQDGVVTVKWTPAIGTENERQSYTYIVYSDSNINGNFSNPAAQNVSPSTNAQGFVSAVITSIPAGHTFFRVSTVKGSVESDKSMTVSPAPAMAIITEVSKYAFFQNATANSSGVFPVSISWKKPDNEEPAFYHVQRSSRSGAGYSRINDIALSANGPFINGYSYNSATETFTFIDRNEMARVGRKYFYRVLSLNQLEQGNFPSDELIGWGALTHTQYMIEFNRTMSAALRKLTFMHRPGSTDKLGTETKNGTISGTIYYNAAISGLGARIIIQLSNYADFYVENDPVNGVYFILSGNSNTSANMSSNGTMDGTMTCDGMYPGRIFYDRIEIKGGAAGGGTYGVQPEGFPRAEIPWTVIE